jgi:hypothetical protein
MKGEDRHKKIFYRSTHMTRDELVRAVHHLLSDHEQREMEMHLTDCELCSEALKGVAEMENASLMYEVSKDLHLRARKKYLLKRTIFSRNELIAIFAVVFLILFLIMMSVFFFMKKNEKAAPTDEIRMEQKK